MNPIRTIPLRPVLILSYDQPLCLLSGLFVLRFLTKIVHAFLISPTSGSCPARFVVLDLTILRMFVEEYKL